MYITSFTSHTFSTRYETKEKRLILALTYGGKLSGDVQQELSKIINGLITSKYIINNADFPNVSKDKKGSPLVGAVVGVKCDFRT